VKAPLVKIRRLAQNKSVKISELIIENTHSVIEAIVDLAETRNVDLIVIGTRGQTGFKKLLTGSVSSGVLGLAHCSVLVVR